MAEIKKNVEKEKKLSKEMVNKKINEIYDLDYGFGWKRKCSKNSYKERW